MNRFLPWTNLVGVVVLAGLCVVQWHANRRVQIELSRQRLSFRDQAVRLEVLAGKAFAQAEDLAELQLPLVRAVDQAHAAAGQLAATESALWQAEAERDQLKASLTNWVAAVADREERLGQAADRANQLAEQRDDAIRRFNELAERHNRLVTEWNELQTRLQEQAKARSATAPR